MKTMMEKIMETNKRANSFGLCPKFGFDEGRVEFIEISHEENCFSFPLLILWVYKDITGHISFETKNFDKLGINVTLEMMKFFLETHEMFYNPEFEC